MDREQIRDGLARLASEAHTAAQSGQRAYDMARRMEKALAEEWEEPEEPEYDPGIRWERCSIILSDKPRGSTYFEVLGRTKDMPRMFVEQFITEAGGVRETVVALHNGYPKRMGAIRSAESACGVWSIKTHDGREILNYDGPVTIPPGRMLVVTDYCFLRGKEPIDTYNPEYPYHGEIERVRFWDGLGERTIKDYAARANDFDEDLRIGLEKALSKAVKSPNTVGPYKVWWDKEGYGHGGQGIEPDRFAWRMCSAGMAFAAEEMFGTANRMGRCMTDESGAFFYDEGTAYTNVASIMPKAFDWTPQGETEEALRRWKNIDGQHFIRAYAAALWLYKETKHPFAGWYLDMLANWMYACHLNTAGDDEPAQDYWSLARKVREFSGPNRHGGRQGAHELRFASEYAKLCGTARSVALSDLYTLFFGKSCDRSGAPFAAKASAFTSSNFPARWGEAKSAQAFELQLALLAMEDTGSETLHRQANKLRDFLTASPPYSFNWETGEKLGKAHPFLEVSTHGVFPGGADALLKMAKERIASQGPEASGANPLNAVRGGDLSRVRDSRGVAR